MSEINFEDFFEPEEENEEDFDFIDPSILSQFQHTSISVEKIQKEILNFDEKDDDEIYGEKATRKFEFQIQVNRVLQIFDEMVMKIETLLCIQEFVKDRKLIEMIFPDEQDFANVMKYSGKLLDIDLSDDGERENVSLVIQTLLGSDLHLHVDDYKENISLQKKIFLSSIKELRNIINSRLQLTAAKELKKEQVLHQMWKKYEKTKYKIASLREKWIYRRENFEEKMRDKYETIERYKQEIDVLRNQNEIEIEEKIKNSNINIVLFCQLKDKTIEQKYSVTEEAKEMYKQFLNENLAKERKLREKKDKAIQAFQAILHKYDVEVGDERTVELEELCGALDVQRRDFATWKETVCEPQIKLHAQLMHEKEEAERQELEAQMMIFMMNRSAKILQKYWRTLVAKKKKKKGRRGKKALSTK